MNPRMQSAMHLAAAALFVLGAVPAHAATVSYTNTFSGLTDVTLQPISLQQFDPALGTLNSATFTLQSSMNTKLTVTYDGSAFFGWDKTTYDLSLVGGSGYSNLQISAALPAQRVVGTGAVGSNFNTSNALVVTGNPNPSTFVQNGPPLSASQTFAVNTGLSPFIGVASLFFYLTTHNQDTVYAAGLQSGGLPTNAGTSMMTTINGQASVLYDYAPMPVPLPAPLALMALGGLLLGRVARRRRNPLA